MRIWQLRNKYLLCVREGFVCQKKKEKKKKKDFQSKLKFIVEFMLVHPDAFHVLYFAILSVSVIHVYYYHAHNSVYALCSTMSMCHARTGVSLSLRICWLSLNTAWTQVRHTNTLCVGLCVALLLPPSPPQVAACSLGDVFCFLLLSPFTQALYVE